MSILGTQLMKGPTLLVSSVYLTDQASKSLRHEHNWSL
jgi:hypothetical protein